MKFEKISANKIKVLVTQDDLITHGISFESFTADSTAVQDFFWNVIRKAEMETDFVADSGRVIVEALHLKNEGIVIFITNPLEDTLLPTQKNRRLRYRVKPKTPAKSEEPYIYLFEEFDDLCAFASKWRYDGANSSLYTMGNQYYLVFTAPYPAFNKSYMEAQILEFGKPAPALKQAYLEEHGQKICDGNAIASIVKYF